MHSRRSITGLDIQSIEFPFERRIKSVSIRVHIVRFRVDNDIVLSSSWNIHFTERPVVFCRDKLNFIHWTNIGVTSPTSILVTDVWITTHSISLYPYRRRIAILNILGHVILRLFGTNNWITSTESLQICAMDRNFPQNIIGFYNGAPSNNAPLRRMQCKAQCSRQSIIRRPHPEYRDRNFPFRC